MRTYQCNKRVQAGKILRMRPTPAPFAPGHWDLELNDGSMVTINTDFINRHGPHIGGYFMKYEDGCTSFSPAHPFELTHVEVRP